MNKNISNHIALIDNHMPIMDGVEVCSIIKNNNLNVKPIIISFICEPFIIHEFIKNGAYGFLSKDTTIKELKNAIKCVHSNNIFLNDNITNRSLTRLLHDRNLKPTINLNVALTKREKEVAVLFYKEYSYKEISNKLNVSTRTIETHKNNIIEKIGASKIAGIIVYVGKMNQN